MRVAALDLGSNTFLLMIADMDGELIRKVILDETRVTRLGQGIHEARAFHPEALARAEAALKEFSELIKKYACEKVVAVATSAARDASNGTMLLEVGLRYGIPIQIISGDQEAEITYDGATADLSADAPAQVIDVGGGSTEVIGRTDGRFHGCSIDIGSVRLTEMFLPQHPCPADDVEKLKAYIDEKLKEKRHELPNSHQRIIAVAGTPTALVGLELQSDFDELKIHKYELTTRKIWAWRDKLAALSIAERQQLPGMQPKRADVLVAGATILAATAEALGGDRVIVSTRGVRYGVARAWQRL